MNESNYENYKHNKDTEKEASIANMSAKFINAMDMLTQDKLKDSINSFALEGTIR